MARVTWGNIADAANRDIQSRIDAVSAAASWDNIPTWDDLNNTAQMGIFRRRSQWANLGMSDEEIYAEMVAEARAAGGGR